MKLVDEDLTEKVIGACFEVSNELGRGFLESVYEKALLIVLQQKGLKAQKQVSLRVNFRDHDVGEFYADIIVEGRLLLELKVAKNLGLEHEAQLINYLKASGIKVGLLINFGQQKVEWKRLIY